MRTATMAMTGIVMGSNNVNVRIPYLPMEIWYIIAYHFLTMWGLTQVLPLLSIGKYSYTLINLYAIAQAPLIDDASDICNVKIFELTGSIRTLPCGGQLQSHTPSAAYRLPHYAWPSILQLTLARHTCGAHKEGS